MCGFSCVECVPLFTGVLKKPFTEDEVGHGEHFVNFQSILIENGNPNVI